MKHVRLEEFLSWAARYGTPHRGGITDNPSARVDIETDAATARITYWESAHCDAEIIDLESGKDLYRKHWDELLPEHLNQELDEFFKVLAVRPAG